MLAAVAEHVPAADVLIMAAAPADFRPAVVAPQKIKKAVAPSSIPLEPTEDVLVATRAVRPPRAIVVGFALETQAALIGGLTKLEQKALDMIVVNDATEPGAGFEKDTNRVSFLIGNAEPEELPILDKTDVAEAILDRVEGIMRGR
jgi:phosphopantothenoylcysteine decarboxylase/phosphopantothenate--cysteine ligase